MEFLETSPNSGHTATVFHTFAQIRQSRTSYVRQPLSEIAGDGIVKVSYTEINKKDGGCNEPRWK